MTATFIKLKQEAAGVTGALKSLISMGYGVKDGKISKTEEQKTLIQKLDKDKKLTSKKE